MDGTEQGTSNAVESPGSASPGTGASSAPGAVTAPPVTEVTPAQPAADSSVQPAQPVVDQPLEAGLEWPNEQELQRMPRNYQNMVMRIKQGYDALESDHKTLKTQFEPWKAVIDKYGDPAAALSDLEAISGLRNFKFDNGNIVLDEVTGQPVYDVIPFVEAIEKQNPALAGHLFDAILSRINPHTGESWAREFLYALGLHPDRLDDYRNYDPSKIANSNAGVDPQARADIVAAFGDKYGPVFDSLPPELQAELPLMEESARRILLDRQAAALDDAKFKDEVRKYQEEQHARATAQFNAVVQADEDQFLGGLRDSVFDSILNDVANQVSISANPQINAMHNQMMRVAFSALLDSTPSVRATVAPMLQAAGINLDFAALDREITQAKQFGAQYAQLKNLANKPGYKGAPPDPRVIEQVRARAEGAAQAVGAHLSNVALKLAQSLGGQIKQQAAVVDKQLREARESRQIVTGSVPTAPTGSPVKRGAPFSRERWDGYGV